MLIKCYVELNDDLARRVIEKEKCTEDEFKARVQQFAEHIITLFFSENYPAEEPVKKPPFDWESLKIGDLVAVPFAETKDTFRIRHGKIEHIDTNKMFCGVELEVPEIGKCVIPHRMSLLLSPQEYAEGAIVELTKEI